MENVTFTEAMTNIANSIIREQGALSDLLDKEASKIDRFIELGATPEQLLEVNNSVTTMIETSNIFNEVLKNKLNSVLPFIE